MAQIDFAVNEKRKMLHQERKKEKELEKRVSVFFYFLFFLTKQFKFNYKINEGAIVFYQFTFDESSSS